MRVSRTASWNWPGESAKPGAMTRTMGSVKISARRVSPSRDASSHCRAERPMAKAAGSPCSARTREKTGMKDMVMAPSAERRRKVLGMR